MDDVDCPYCGESQEICHDDGFGYSEDEDHEQACVSCDKAFIFQTSIMYNYSAYCVGGHDLEQPFEEMHPDYYHCKRCEYSEIRRDSK